MSFLDVLSAYIVGSLTSNYQVSYCGEQIPVFSGLAGKEGGSASPLSCREQN